MVINLHKTRRWRADEHGRRWSVGSYRRTVKAMYRYRVWLNDREVTNETFYVDARRGLVRMYLRDAEGHFYVDGDHVARVERRGHVRLVRRPEAA